MATTTPVGFGTDYSNNSAEEKTPEKESLIDLHKTPLADIHLKMKDLAQSQALIWKYLERIAAYDSFPVQEPPPLMMKYLKERSVEDKTDNASLSQISNVLDEVLRMQALLYDKADLCHRYGESRYYDPVYPQIIAKYKQ